MASVAVQRVPPPLPLALSRGKVGSIAELITGRLSVAAGTPISQVVKVFEQNPGTDAIAVLEQGCVRAVFRTRFFLQLGRRFGFSLFENRPIDLLAEDASTVEAGADPIEVISLALQREADRVYDDLLVVGGGRYLGTVSMRTLLVHHKDLLAASMAERAVLDERNRRLEELNRIQGEFVANMTHELRSPVNMILGIAGLMLGDAELDEKHRRELFLLVARGQELLGIVNNMLDIARLESGAMQPSLEPVDLHELFEEQITLAERLAAGKLLNVQLRLTKIPATFVTDGVYLRRILVNLLSNAVKFTDAGNVTLAAQAGPSILTIEVSDSGLGIREEDLPRLFRKFTQLEATKTKRHRGSGLGLAIVKSLVDQLGGTIEVASRLGVGSRFTVKLRSVLPEAPEQRGEEAP